MSLGRSLKFQVRMKMALCRTPVFAVVAVIVSYQSAAAVAPYCNFPSVPQGERALFTCVFNSTNPDILVERLSPNGMEIADCPLNKQDCTIKDSNFTFISRNSTVVVLNATSRPEIVGSYRCVSRPQTQAPVPCSYTVPADTGDESKLSGGDIAGIVIGVLAAVVVLIAAAVILLFKKRIKELCGNSAGVGPQPARQFHGVADAVSGERQNVPKVVTQTGAAAGGDQNVKQQEYQKDKSEIRAEINDMKTQLLSKIEDLQEKLTAKETQMTKLQSDINTLKEENQQQKTRIKELEAEFDKVKSERDELKKDKERLLEEKAQLEADKQDEIEKHRQTKLKYKEKLKVKDTQLSHACTALKNQGQTSYPPTEMASGSVPVSSAQFAEPIPAPSSIQPVPVSESSDDHDAASDACTSSEEKAEKRGESIQEPEGPEMLGAGSLFRPRNSRRRRTKQSRLSPSDDDAL